MFVTITKIEPQKRKKNRYSLFAGDQFIAGISDQTLLEFNLYTGQKISQELLDKINAREEYFRLRDQAIRFLARRSHSKREISIKLSRKGFDKNSIKKIIHELEEKKYLDDDHFARIYTRDEIRLKKTGPLRIRNKLREKGISLDMTAEVIQSLYPEELQSANALELASNKLKNARDLSAGKLQVTLTNYLKSRGYPWNIVSPIVQKLTGEFADDAD